MVWIERRPGAVWAVGRAVNLSLRPSQEPRPDDYVWEGYELEDALEAANGTLEDDCVVSEDDGSTEKGEAVSPRGAARAPRALLRPLTRRALRRGPPQVGVRDRVAVRVVRRVAERPVDRASSSSEITCSNRGDFAVALLVNLDNLTEKSFHHSFDLGHLRKPPLRNIANTLSRCPTAETPSGDSKPQAACVCRGWLLVQVSRTAGYLHRVVVNLLGLGHSQRSHESERQVIRPTRKRHEVVAGFPRTGHNVAERQTTACRILSGPPSPLLL